MSDHTEHDCAATSRTYLLGIGSCRVCGWSVWRDIWTTVSYGIRSRLNGDNRAADKYAQEIGMKRRFTWRDGWEWYHPPR